MNNFTRNLKETLGYFVILYLAKSRENDLKVKN